jgi:hypothetical protein
MKIKFIVLSVFLLFASVAKSQVMWILLFGDKLSNDKIQSGINISVASVNYIGFNKSNYLNTWALGGFTDIQLNNHWSLQPEFVFKSPTGANNLNDYFSFLSPPDSLIKDANVYIEGVNFSLPIFIKYEARIFGFGIGPQFNLAYSTQLKLKGKTMDDSQISLKKRYGDFINKFDVGMTAGLEFYLSPNKKQTSMRLGIKYYYGFLNVFKDKYEAHNSVLMLSLGIPVVSKKAIENKMKNK